MEYQIEDIENIHQKFRAMIDDKDKYKEEVSKEDESHYLSFLKEASTSHVSLSELKMKYSIMKKNSTILQFARRLCREEKITTQELEYFESLLRIKKGKSHSGVLVVTIFTSAYPEYIGEDGVRKTQAFSCKWNCHYCPNQPGQPRSYLEGEPGVLRANSNNFDCCSQMWDRMETLYNTGHPIDKLEVLVLGGTWESYPLAYRKDFIRDMYYAANTFWEEPSSRRIKASLAVERNANRDSICKIIGLTLETRPDTITEEAIIQAREFGCTRFQIGIQHTHDDVLRKINRQCPTYKTIAAIELLKNWGYKVDGHWMPNLPGSSPEKDRDMLVHQLLHQSKAIEYIQSPVAGIDEWSIWSMGFPEFQLDQWKIYPCEVVPYTQIEQWYKNGEYKPYGEKDLESILLETKRKMVPWIRLNRIIRDIPTDYIMASGDRPNMRQELVTKMKKMGQKCHCIRCREVKQNKIPDVLFYRVREYRSSRGTEYFISAEDQTGDILCGFVRLRLADNQNIAWIRELHVYGQLQKTTTQTISSHATQHRGIGKTLMSLAEEISSRAERQTLKVISGEGTKRYYERLGYTEGTYGYMEKIISDKIMQR